MSDEDVKEMKASEVLLEVYKDLKEFRKQFELLDARFQNLEFLNRTLISEQRKILKLVELGGTLKFSSEQPKQEQIKNALQKLPIKKEQGLNQEEFVEEKEEIAKENIEQCFVTQKVVYSDGEPAKLTKVEIKSKTINNVFKKTVTDHTGTWKRTDLPSGKYEVHLIKETPAKGHEPIDERFDFEVYQKTLDLGKFEVK